MLLDRENDGDFHGVFHTHASEASACAIVGFVFARCKYRIDLLKEHRSLEAPSLFVVYNRMWQIYIFFAYIGGFIGILPLDYVRLIGCRLDV